MKLDCVADRIFLNFILMPAVITVVLLMCFRPDFTSLLESGDLSEKSSVQFTPSDAEFQLVLAKLCFFHHFRGKFTYTLSLTISLLAFCISYKQPKEL